MIDFKSIKKIFNQQNKYTKPLNSQNFNKIFNNINLKIQKEINIRNNKSEYENEQLKNELLNPIFKEINVLLLDDVNPLKALRLRLIEIVEELSFFEVLMPSSKVLVHTSGDLHQYVKELLSMNEKMEETLLAYNINNDSTTDEIQSAIKKHIKNLSLRVKALNIARKEIGDFHRDKHKDWFGYCFLSFSVYHEEMIRRHLSLNSIMIGKDKEQRLNIYSSWYDLASYDDNNLLSSWEEILETHNLKNVFDLKSF